MIATPRFEEKFILSQFQYRQVVNGLAGFARRDAYSEAAPARRYFVGSLYFDTSDYRAYTEKVTGENRRIKLRIRSYSRKRTDAAFVSVEIKTRNGRLITKYGTHVATELYDEFMRTGSWKETDDPVLIEFERVARAQCQKPKLLVEYDREAFVSLDPAGPRISFDHNVRYARSTSLFPDSAMYRSEPICPVILEIKTPDEGPDWLQELVRDLSLKSVPNSKYANAVEQTQADMFLGSY